MYFGMIYLSQKCISTIVILSAYKGLFVKSLLRSYIFGTVEEEKRKGEGEGKRIFMPSH